MLPKANQHIIEFTTLEDLQNYKNQFSVSLTIGSFDAIHLPGEDGCRANSNDADFFLLCIWPPAGNWKYHSYLQGSTGIIGKF